MTAITLADPGDVETVSAPWMSSFVVLGSRLCRRATSRPADQLVVVLTVPVRDYVAALLACGWAMSFKVGDLPDPLMTLRSLEPGDPIRAVNAEQIVEGFFTHLDDSSDEARVRFGRSTYFVSGLQALVRRPGLAEERDLSRPEPGQLAYLAGLDKDWPARLAAANPQVAVIGTLVWLERDFDTSIGCENAAGAPTPMREVALATSDDKSVGLTQLFAQSEMDEVGRLAPGLRGVFLDGAVAFRLLSLISAPVVVCIVDRSVADAGGAELINQRLQTRGTALSIDETLGWQPPAGVEAVSFTVPT